MKSLILKFLKLLKCYKKEINNLKLFILLIINCYFFYIIWSIIIDQDSNIINNNTILNSLSLYVKPILDDLNIIVSLNIVNMLIITIIFVLINMLIFKLNKIYGIIGLGISARLGYKTYKDYLNNLNELNIIGFEKKKHIAEEVVDKSAQIMEQIENTKTFNTPKEAVGQGQQAEYIKGLHNNSDSIVVNTKTVVNRNETIRQLKELSVNLEDLKIKNDVDVRNIQIKKSNILKEWDAVKHEWTSQINNIDTNNLDIEVKKMLNNIIEVATEVSDSVAICVELINVIKTKE